MTELADLTEVKSFPTIRAQMGDWYYYITTLPFYEVAKRVLPASELLHPSPTLSEWIQREVMPARRDEIATYLVDQPQRFFSGIVVGVYHGEPNWYGIDVDDNNLFGAPGLDPRFSQALGILELSGDEKLYAIDGQHRVAGIKQALENLQKLDTLDLYHELANDDLAIIFVAADMEAGHLERVRRMFSTLNKRMVKVSIAELIALDEDDAGPITTRRLAIGYPQLNPTSPVKGSKPDLGIVHLGKSTQIARSNRHSFTTIVTLLDIVRSAFKDELKALAAKHASNRPSEKELDDFYELNVRMWEGLRNAVPEVKAVLGSQPSDRKAAEYRRADGGHLLFRPIGQQAFAGALGVLRARGIDMELAIENLAKAPMDISMAPWRHVVWDPSTAKMVNSNRVVAQNLLLHMVGEEPKSGSEAFRKRYEELRGDLGQPLDALPVNRVRTAS